MLSHVLLVLGPGATVRDLVDLADDLAVAVDDGLWSGHPAASSLGVERRRSAFTSVVLVGTKAPGVELFRNTFHNS